MATNKKDSPAGSSSERAPDTSSFGTLQQLAKVENRPKPKTPEHPIPRSVRRTPAAGRLNPKSPHALRAFEQQRRLSLGRERRRSLVSKSRVSDIDMLRNLSRALAPGSKLPDPNTPTSMTPKPPPSSRRPRRSSAIVMYPEKPVGEIYDDDDEMPAPPRLSFNYNDYRDDSDDDLPVPQLSQLPGDEDGDVRSSRRRRSLGIEAGRRARHRVSDYGIPDMLEEDDDPLAHLNNTTRRGFGFELDDTQVSFRDRDSRLSILQNDDDSYSLERSNESRMLLPDHDEVDDFQIEVLQDGSGGNKHDEGSGIYNTNRPGMTSMLGDDSMQAGEELLEDTDVDVYEDMAEFGPGGFEIRMDEEGDDVGIDADARARRPTVKPLKIAKKRIMNTSAIGVEYPPFPKRVIKKLAQQYAGANISNETLKILEAATDKFFEQASVDLGAYADHAGRKTIDDSDALMMFKRQRRINPHTTLFSLAQKHLPRELAQHIRMPVPPKGRGKQTRKT